MAFRPAVGAASRTDRAPIAPSSGRSSLVLSPFFAGRSGGVRGLSFRPPYRGSDTCGETVPDLDRPLPSIGQESTRLRSWCTRLPWRPRTTDFSSWFAFSASTCGSASWLATDHRRRTALRVSLGEVAEHVRISITLPVDSL